MQGIRDRIDKTSSVVVKCKYASMTGEHEPPLNFMPEDIKLMIQLNRFQ
jgi:hypothetical protein